MNPWTTGIAWALGAGRWALGAGLATMWLGAWLALWPVWYAWHVSAYVGIEFVAGVCLADVVIGLVRRWRRRVS